MDYFVYVYLQSGHDQDASKVIQQLNDMAKLNEDDFKIAYASTAMPIRYAVERGQWREAAGIVPLKGALPQVVAIVVWA